MLNSVSHTSVSLFPQCCAVLFPVKICRSGACQKSCPEELSKNNESLHLEGSQEQECRFCHFTTRNGLQSSIIKAIRA